MHKCFNTSHHEAERCTAELALKSLLDALVSTLCRNESTAKVVPWQSFCKGCQQDFHEVTFKQYHFKIAYVILGVYFLE